MDDMLDAYYAALDCGTIDIVGRDVRGIPVNIVCDDEALLRENVIVSSCMDCGTSDLCGSLFIAGPCDEDGNLTSLSPEARRAVLERIHAPNDYEEICSFPLRIARNVLVVDENRGGINTTPEQSGYFRFKDVIDTTPPEAKPLGHYRGFAVLYVECYERYLITMWEDTRFSMPFVESLMLKRYKQWLRPEENQDTHDVCCEDWVLTGLDELGLVYDYTYIEDPVFE